MKRIRGTASKRTRSTASVDDYQQAFKKLQGASLLKKSNSLNRFLLRACPNLTTFQKILIAFVNEKGQSHQHNINVIAASFAGFISVNQFTELASMIYQLQRHPDPNLTFDETYTYTLCCAISCLLKQLFISQKMGLFHQLFNPIFYLLANQFTTTQEAQIRAQGIIKALFITFLESKSNPKSTPDIYFTPFLSLLLAKSESINANRILFKHWIRESIIHAHHRTPLELFNLWLRAIENGNTPVTTFLLSIPYIKQKAHHGNNKALTLAVKGGHTPIVKKLLQNTDIRATCTGAVLLTAIRLKHHAIIQALLKGKTHRIRVLESAHSLMTMETPMEVRSVVNSKLIRWHQKFPHKKPEAALLAPTHP